MDSNKTIIEDINNIINLKVDDFKIKDYNIIKSTQINCSVPEEENRKDIINILKKIEEKILHTIINFKINEIDSDIPKKIENIRQLMIQFKSIIETIKIQVPNNIEFDDKIKKEIIPLYQKFIKAYEKSKKELVEKTKYFLSLFRKFPESIKELYTSINANKVKFEEISHKIKDEKDDIKAKKYLSEIFKSYQNIFESFNLYESFMSELDDAEKNFENKIFNKLNSKINDIKMKINNHRNSFPEIDKFFPLMSIKTIDNLNKISIQLKENFREFQNYKIKRGKVLIDENIIRLDLLIILDITNSMGKYLKFIQNNLGKIIAQIKEKCPLYLIYLGFIGYKDFADLDMGDEYTDIDFTINYDSLYNKIKDIDPDGGDDIPEDVAGAFKMAKEKHWGNGSKLIILITDSPCHGIEYHDLDQSKKDYIDNYPTGFYENKEDKEENEEYKREKIDNYVKYFAVNNISMICFKILNITDKMFKCFETIYKKENKSELFSIERNNLDKLIINKATEIYDKKQVELINKLKEKYLNN